MIKDYKVLLMDLWGVIHDGTSFYDGALEALQYIKNIGKTVIFITNAPRRKNIIQKSLDIIGVPKNLYSDIVSAGEVAHTSLSINRDFGNKFFYLSSKGYDEVIDIKGYKISKNPKDADFALITGVIDHYNEAIDKAKISLEHNLPLLCVNPDEISINTQGHISKCAGMVAKFYEEKGGKVIYFGKPHKLLYQSAFKLLKKNIHYQNILAIGDSLPNDIAGANNMGIDSALVLSGIHRLKLDIKIGSYPTQDKLSSLFKEYSQKPKFYISLLKDLIE